MKTYRGETHVIDIGIFWGLEYTVSHGLPDIYEQAAVLVNELENWSAPTGGIVVKTPADLEAETERRSRLRDERAPGAPVDPGA